MKEAPSFNINAAQELRVLPGMTQEETLSWKIEKKSSFSQRLERKSFEQLQNEFPDGYIEQNQFIVDVDSHEPMRRFFDNRGFEVEREFYKPSLTEVGEVKDGQLIKRVQSEYDEEGYLTGVIVMKAGVGGYIRTIEYEEVTTGRAEKAPKRAITQDVLPNPTDPALKTPGWPVSYRPPVIVDFTDVPFITPKKLKRQKEIFSHSRR